jgi:AbrB family looped-hinge helix DNA binding protein
MRSATTRVGPRFRIVIPKKIRDAAGIKEGDFIEAEVRPGGILLRPKALIDRDWRPGLRKLSMTSKQAVFTGRTKTRLRDSTKL